MHRRDADDQLVHEGGESGVDDEGDEHARRQVGYQPAHNRNEDRDRDVADAAEAERAAHRGVVGGAGDLMPAAVPRDQETHLDQRDDAGADHRAVRDVELGDVYAGDRERVAADQEADAEHRQCPDIADKGDAEGRHRNLQPAAGDADEEPDTKQRRPPAARVAGADRLGCGDAGRPGAGCREHARIEHAVEHVSIEQHRQRGANQHRQDQIRAAEQEGDADRQQQAVGGAEGRRRDRALREVLHMDRSVACEDRARHARQ